MDLADQDRSPVAQAWAQERQRVAELQAAIDAEREQAAARVAEVEGRLAAEVERHQQASKDQERAYRERTQGARQTIAAADAAAQEANRESLRLAGELEAAHAEIADLKVKLTPPPSQRPGPHLAGPAADVKNYMDELAASPTPERMRQVAVGLQRLADAMERQEAALLAAGEGR